jgi:hypothetical protein
LGVCNIAIPWLLILEVLIRIIAIPWLLFLILVLHMPKSYGGVTYCVIQTAIPWLPRPWGSTQNNRHSVASDPSAFLILKLAFPGVPIPF